MRSRRAAFLFFAERRAEPRLRLCLPPCGDTTQLDLHNSQHRARSVRPLKGSTLAAPRFSECQSILKLNFSRHIRYRIYNAPIKREMPRECPAEKRTTPQYVPLAPAATPYRQTTQRRPAGTVTRDRTDSSRMLTPHPHAAAHYCRTMDCGNANCPPVSRAATRHGCVHTVLGDFTTQHGAAGMLAAAVMRMDTRTAPWVRRAARAAPRAVAKSPDRNCL